MGNIDPIRQKASEELLACRILTLAKTFYQDEEHKQDYMLWLKQQEKERNNGEGYHND